MKTKLQFVKQNPTLFYTLLVLCLCFNYGHSQTNLVLNGSCDEFTVNTGDNADAWDITPNNTVVDNTNTEVPSPYQAIWDNDPLEDYLEGLYNGGSNLDEQPGSTSNGAGGTRGIKLYNDGSPVPQGGECTRRIYQKVVGLTIGEEYTFSVDSRSEATGVPSEVFMLNEEISTEVGLENGAADSRVDAFLNIANDFNTDSSVFTTNTLTFTASNTFVVIYIRALGANAEDNEVFYDNFSLVLTSELSVKDLDASNFKVFPNPAKSQISIESKNTPITSVEIHDLLGKKVLEQKMLSNQDINVSDLSNGIYLLTIKADNKSVTKKLVIE